MSPPGDPPVHILTFHIRPIQMVTNLARYIAYPDHGERQISTGCLSRTLSARGESSAAGSKFCVVLSKALVTTTVRFRFDRVTSTRRPKSRKYACLCVCAAAMRPKQVVGGRPPQYAPPLSFLWAPKRRARPSRRQRSSSFSRPTCSHIHRCSCLTRQHSGE